MEHILCENIFPQTSWFSGQWNKLDIHKMASLIHVFLLFISPWDYLRTLQKQSFLLYCINNQECTVPCLHFWGRMTLLHGFIIANILSLWMMNWIYTKLKHVFMFLLGFDFDQECRWTSMYSFTAFLLNISVTFMELLTWPVPTDSRFKMASVSHFVSTELTERFHHFGS